MQNPLLAPGRPARPPRRPDPSRVILRHGLRLMDMDHDWTVTRVGTVRSDVRDRAKAPCQADEGAPPAWLEFAPEHAGALADVAPERDGLRVRVSALEAIDGTPVVDVKPVLGSER